MRQTQFDSFGERLPQSSVQARGPERSLSLWVLRGGIAFFWSLVAVVVAARVIYFDPALVAKFGELAARLAAIVGA